MTDIIGHCPSLLSGRGSIYALAVEYGRHELYPAVHRQQLEACPPWSLQRA